MEQQAATPHQTGDARPRIYLAGPDIFFRDSAEIYRSLKALCERHGLVGV